MPRQSLRARYGGSPQPLSRASSFAESEVGSQSIEGSWLYSRVGYELSAWHTEALQLRFLQRARWLFVACPQNAALSLPEASSSVQILGSRLLGISCWQTVFHDMTSNAPQVSDLLQRIGSLTSKAGRETPASALPPIPRPPSLTSRRRPRPPAPGTGDLAVCMSIDIMQRSVAVECFRHLART